MTTPRDRIAYGPHVFPFTGLYPGGEDFPGLPLLPVRFQRSDGAWSLALNALLDTGSTRCILTRPLARALGLESSMPAEGIKGAGGPFQAAPVKSGARIVDAHYPDATFWEVADLPLWIPVEEDALDITVLGWNLLRLFDVTVSHRRARIELRPAMALAGGAQWPTE